MNYATQEGVRYSIINQDVYVENNLIGFYNILEACYLPYDNETSRIGYLVYASGSSVHGSSKKALYRSDDKVDSPVSLYTVAGKATSF